MNIGHKTDVELRAPVLHVPARRMLVRVSKRIFLRSNAPAAAPCHNMAYSPDTWYSARG